MTIAKCAMVKTWYRYIDYGHPTVVVIVLILILILLLLLLLILIIIIRDSLQWVYKLVFMD